jgi:hypothetical protein
MISNLRAERKPLNGEEIKERKRVDQIGFRLTPGFAFAGCGFQLGFAIALTV